MLPKSFVEKQIRFFRFWFNHQLQDGLHYQNELFRCLHTAEAPERFQLYRWGRQLAQEGADILVTHRHNQYSLWISLRSQPRLLKSLQTSLPSGSFPSSKLQLDSGQYKTRFSRKGDLLANHSDAVPQLMHSKRKVIGR